jgi:hypothetical protein
MQKASFYLDEEIRITFLVVQQCPSGTEYGASTFLKQKDTSCGITRLLYARRHILGSTRNPEKRLFNGSTGGDHQGAK